MFLVARLITTMLGQLPSFLSFQNPFDKVSKTFGEFSETVHGLSDQWLSNPLYIISTVALLALLIAFIVMSKVKLQTKDIARIALMIALAIMLNLLTFYRMPQGGSVTLGSMVPLFLVGLAYGPAVGAFSGFTFGIINMLLGGYVVHPIQMLLDYPLAFMCMGLIGFFPGKTKYIGVIVSFSGQLLASLLSGVIFFYEYAGEMNPWLYSLSYNGSFLVVEMLICLVLMTVLPVNRLVNALKK